MSGPSSPTTPTNTTTATTRKRSNSIIPMEFRNDTTDGGMERAALATVFGVLEYTESKIFWNAEEELPTAADEQNNNNTTGIKQVQRNLSKRSYTNQRHVSPNNKVLPSIPVVSEFGDIWSEVNSTFPPYHRLKDKRFSSLKIQIDEQLQNALDNPLPVDLSDSSISLFDIIQSDEDPNFILWGLSNKQSTIPPTAPYRQQHNVEDEKKKKFRWSAQQLIPSIVKKKSASMYKNNTNGSIHSTTSVVTVEEDRVIEAATIEKLVEKLTISLDYTFMTDFFLIFRVFMTPLQLCKYLILRFRWSIENNEERRCVVRIRTFVVMRHWLLNYFLHDFIPSRELREVLTNFLNAMPFHPLIKQSPRDQRIIKGLKRVVRRLKKIYYASSSSATQVQVIGPPPPTFEQEKVAAMVKDKLAQSTIKQKTLNIVDRIHVDARHSSNTAIKNKNNAPVVIIGSIPAKESTATLHRRRRSSVSSSAVDFTSRNSQRDSNASREWSSLQKFSQPEYLERSASNDSLESALSPGTSDYEQDNDDDEDSLSEFDDYMDESESNIESNIPDDVHSSTEQSHIASDELSHKLEQLRLKQVEDDKRTRVEQILTTERINPTIALSQSNSAYSNMRPRSFYSAQLAIPSAVSTPDIYYTPDYFDNNGQSNNVVNSISYNSMAYPSVTDSGVATPLNPENQTGKTTTQQNQLQDPKFKPLPALNEKPSLPTYAKDKKLPDKPPIVSCTLGEEKPEVWKLSTKNNIKELAPLYPEGEFKKSESNLTEKTNHTPKSRIVELDIDHNHHIPELEIPPFIPATTLLQHEHRYRSSIVLSYSTSLMAQQFCLIERTILLDINWEELVDCKWTKMSASTLYQPHDSIYQENSSGHGKEETQHQTPIEQQEQGMYSRKKRMKQQEEKNNESSERGIEKAINRFNAVCQWVSSEIVQTKLLEDRVKLIEKFIRLAKKCKLYCNFSTLIQILLGLQSSSVSRLDKTWRMVRRKEMKILQELSTFTSPTKNWKNIRDSMTQVAEEYGSSPTEIQVQVPQGKSKHHHKTSSVTIKLPFGGCIPFLGIYLSDLVFNAELPSFLPSPNNGAGDLQGLAKQASSQPLVHLRKHRITATVIKRVLVFQNLAKRYSFEESTDSLLYLTCLQVPSLDLEATYNASCEIEPPVHH